MRGDVGEEADQAGMRRRVAEGSAAGAMMVTKTGIMGMVALVASVAEAMRVAGAVMVTGGMGWRGMRTAVVAMGGLDTGELRPQQPELCKHSTLSSCLPWHMQVNSSALSGHARPQDLDVAVQQAMCRAASAGSPTDWVCGGASCGCKARLVRSRLSQISQELREAQASSARVESRTQAAACQPSKSRPQAFQSTGPVCFTSRVTLL